MFLLFIFASVFYIRSLKNFIFRRYLSNKRQFFFKKADTIMESGYDYRYSLKSSVNKTQLEIFAKNLKKLYILNKLNDTSINDSTKLDIITNYSTPSHGYNLYAGGLVDLD